MYRKMPQNVHEQETTRPSAGPMDLRSITFCDLPITLAEVVSMPGNGAGDRLLGGQGRVDDDGSAGHVYCLEALHDWCSAAPSGF
jgi:hypothetical protein